MILRRYGTSFRSVEANFDSKALTEVGFRRDQAYSVSVDEFLEGYQRVSEHLLEAEAEGDVQDEVESEMLRLMLDQLVKLESELADGEFVVVESQQGQDYPKTKTRQKNVVVDGENRLHFFSSVSPPLKIAVFKAR